MSYLPSEAKFVGPTETYYIIYEHSFTGKARDGSTYKRTQTRVKRVYISGKLLKWKVGTFTNKRGKTVHGVMFIYKNPVKGYSASRGGTRYRVSKKFVIVKKVVSVPRSAKNIRVSKVAPKGPLMDIT